MQKDYIGWILEQGEKVTPIPPVEVKLQAEKPAALPPSFVTEKTQNIPVNLSLSQAERYKPEPNSPVFLGKQYIIIHTHKAVGIAIPGKGEDNVPGVFWIPKRHIHYKAEGKLPWIPSGWRYVKCAVPAEITVSSRFYENNREAIDNLPHH